MPYIKLITLTTATATGVGLGLSFGVARQEFRRQANEAYNNHFPERANDTLREQAQDMQRDAFRHAYTSARMAEIYGRDVAHFLGDLNEAMFNNYGPGPRIMDYYNNDRGLDINEQLKNISNPFLVKEDLSNALKSALDNKQLHTSEVNPPSRLRTQ